MASAADHAHRVATWQAQLTQAKAQRDADLKAAMRSVQADVVHTETDRAQHAQRLAELHRRLAELEADNAGERVPAPPADVTPIDLDRLED